LTECDAGGHRLFFEGSVTFIEIKLVGLGVVGEQDVGPAIVVVVENSDSQALGRRLVKSRLLRHIGKLAAALVVPKPRRGSLVGLRRAIRFVGSIQRAEQVCLYGPL